MINEALMVTSWLHDHSHSQGTRDSRPIWGISEHSFYDYLSWQFPNGHFLRILLYINIYTYVLVLYVFISTVCYIVLTDGWNIQFK